MRSAWLGFTRSLGLLGAAVALLVGVLVSPALGASTSTSSSAALESPGVRAELATQRQGQGPLVVTQGGSGASEAPAGELQPELSTADSNTWRPRGGLLTTRIYPAPINYKGSDGKWHAISNQLVPTALNGYQNEANDFQLQLPMSLASGMTLNHEGQSLTFALQNGKEALPIVNGAVARYSEALDATDFEYESNSTGVKETATLKNSAAPEELRFTLSASPGLSARLTPDGGVELLDGQGAEAFRIPAPLAYRPGEDPGSGKTLPLTLTQSGSGWVVAIDTSAPWLRTALASGPVLIDPTVSVGGSQNCWIESDSPKSTFCSQTGFDVGYQSEAPAHEHHGLLKFNLSSIPLAANVFDAKLGLYVQSKSTSTSKPIGVYRVTKPWTTGATWESYDGTNAWTTAGGDYNNPSENSDASVNPSVGASTGWSYWYPTKMVQEWVNGTNAPAGEGAENNGLIVKDETDNTINNVLTFSSIRASSNQPFLEVKYEPRGYGSEPEYTTLSARLTDRSGMNVNVASGNLMVQAEDLKMGGVNGLGFTSEHIWNSLNPELQEYGYWTDFNALGAQIWGDGSVTVNDNLGEHYTFQKKVGGAFITPPDIKASLCGIGSPAPCPTTLPSGVAYRLTYDQGQFHYDYSSEGAPLDEQNQYSNTIGHEWPSAGHQVFTDTHGHKIEEISNSETWITEIKDLSGGRTMKYAYEKIEGSTDLVSFTDANGKITKYGYAGTKLASITDPTGEVTKFEYDGQHRVTAIIRTTNAEHTTGPTTRFVYDEVGHAPSPCTASEKATIVRDPDWREAKPGLHETTYCANVLDEVEKTINSEGRETKQKYNALGDTTSTTAAAPGAGEGGGNVLSNVYDEAKRNVLCQVTGASTEATSCPGRPDESGLETSYEYNGKNTPFTSTHEENPQGNKLSNCLSKEGQEGASEHGEEPCTAEAGPAGTLQNRIDQLPTQNQLTYTYNTSGVSDGTIKTSTDADGHTTEYLYDEHGNIKEAKPPSPQEPTKITVDGDSRPEVITDGSGHKATFTYDALDRVTKIVYSGGGGVERTVKNTYDADGNLTQREDPTGTTKYKTDQLNRLTKEELPGSAVNEYGYDEASNTTSFTDSGGTTTYAYSRLNLLESMTEPSAAKATTFAYDNDGRLDAVTYPSGVKETYKLEETTGRPEKITVEGTTGLTVPTMTYTYKQGKNSTALMRTVAESSGNETTYSYDQLDRLTKAVTKGTNPAFYRFELDGAGNRTEQRVNPEKETETGYEPTFYVYNNDNQLQCRQTVAPAPGCSASATTELSHYSYDNAGEETAITPKSDTTGSAFTYNSAGELSKLTPSGGSEESLSYGGVGQGDLVSFGSTGLQNSVLGVTKDTTAAGTSYLARTPGGLLVDQRTPSGSYNPLYDAQGDVIALVNSSGKVERTFRYGPYGENVKSEGTQTIPYLFGYKGGLHMPGGNTGKGNVANGLDHFGQRFYDPTVGRWTQQDSFVQLLSPTESGLYQGFGGDPVNLSDPTGEPGEPAGAQCESNSNYNREHRTICAEEEATAEEGLEAIDDVCEVSDDLDKVGARVPIASTGCEAYSDGKKAVEIYEEVSE